MADGRPLVVVDFPRETLHVLLGATPQPRAAAQLEPMCSFVRQIADIHNKHTRVLVCSSLHTPHSEVLWKKAFRSNAGIPVRLHERSNSLRINWEEMVENMFPVPVVAQVDQTVSHQSDIGSGHMALQVAKQVGASKLILVSSYDGRVDEHSYRQEALSKRIATANDAAGKGIIAGVLPRGFLNHLGAIALRNRFPEGVYMGRTAA